MTRFSAIICVLLFPFLASGQGFPSHLLDALNARQQGNGIEVSWTMSRGVICLGIDVERSVNGSPFERVFRIGGVCGSPDWPETYRYNDEGLTETGYYEYRLLFGTIGQASVSSPFQQVWESGVSVVPAGNGHQLRVETVAGRYDLDVYSLQGVLLFSERDLMQPTTYLPTEAWPAGIYVVHVNGQGTLRQSFAIVR